MNKKINRRPLIAEVINERILLLDGSMGVMLQRLQLGEAGTRGRRFISHPRPLASNFDILSLSRPEIVAQVHDAYLKAGADIIETNTFNANALSQKEYGTDSLVWDMNYAAATTARREADRFTKSDPSKPRFVAGSMGPTAFSASLPVDVDDPLKRSVDFDTLSGAYQEQADGLIRGGVDLLLIETSYDLLNAKAAAFGAKKAMEENGITVPVIFSMTISDASGRILSGHTPEACLTSLSGFSPLAVGYNCSTGKDDLTDAIKRMEILSPYPVVFYPNAGHPDETGAYGLSPEGFVEMVRPLLEEGKINIIGGCCGTTPEHISSLRKVLDSGKFTVRRTESKKLPWLCGFDPFYDNRGFINVAGSRKFLRLLQENNLDGILDIARRQIDSGAMVLDINMDDAMLDSVVEMKRFLRLLGSDPVTASVPWMIDSSDFNVIEQALKEAGGKMIVNSISLRDGESEFIRRAGIIKSYGAAVVVMLFDEKGQAVTFDRKIAVASRAYDILTEKCGYNPRDIIIDANILTVATGMPEHNNYALDFIKAVGWINHNLPGVKTSGGVSNLSFAFRGNHYVRQAMHSVFLFHAIKAGLSMAILSPDTKVAYSDVPPQLLDAIENVLFNRHENASDELVETAASYNVKINESVPQQNQVDKEVDVDARLCLSLRNGSSQNLEDDLEEAVRVHGSAQGVVEGPLMAAMEEVGKLFGEGKLFLPQVVKSARVMRQAVDYLTPLFEQGDSTAMKAKGCFLMATVRGDVHDIGKNIAGAVLQCNGYKVIDLGVQVEASEIIRACHEHNPDFIGLSGLISPSLDEMVSTVKALKGEGIHVPVFVGGAATSDVHAALKIAPEYDGIVVRVSDASRNPIVASRLQADYESFAADIKLHQKTLIERYNERKNIEGNGICEKPHVDWEHAELVNPTFTGSRTLRGIPVSEVIPFINFTYLYKCWNVTPGSDAAESLKQDAESLLREFVESSACMDASIAFYGAYGADDRIVLENGTSINTPRQKVKPSRSLCYSLADFVAPEGYGDHIGCFMVTIGDKIRERLASARKTGEYDSLLMQSVCDRLAEAASEWLHMEVRRRYWGYENPVAVDMENIRRGKYAGIRPAVGYPSLPDQRQMLILSSLLNTDEIGVSVTVNGALNPSSTVAGIYIASPNSHYFTLE